MPTTCPNQIAHETLSWQPQEAAMSIIRLIHIKIDPTEMENALQVWKTECAPLMIQQKGCIFGKASALPGGQRTHLLFGMKHRR